MTLRNTKMGTYTVVHTITNENYPVYGMFAAYSIWYQHHFLEHSWIKYNYSQHSLDYMRVTSIIIETVKCLKWKAFCRPHYRDNKRPANPRTFKRINLNFHSVYMEIIVPINYMQFSSRKFKQSKFSYVHTQLH